MSLVVLFVSAEAMGLPQPSPGDFVPIFANGTHGYTCFRIPAIVRTPDGILLAFVEARRESCADYG